MDDNEIIIPFKFPIDPQLEDLQASVSDLISSTLTLSKTMSEMPISTLNQQLKEQQKALAEVAQVTMSVNKADQESLVELNLMAKTLDKNIASIEGLIKAKTIWGQTSDQVSNGIKGLQSSLNSLDKEMAKVLAGTSKSKLSLSELQTEYKKVEDTLKIYQASMEKTVASQKAEADSIAGLIELAEMLGGEWKKLSAEERANAEIGGVMEKQISALNITIDAARMRISGLLEVESARNKILEQNIKTQNFVNEIDSKSVEIYAAKQIAIEKFNAEVADKISLEKTGYTVSENALLKQMELEEKRFDEAWELGQKWLINEQERYEKAFRLGEVWAIRRKQQEEEVFNTAWKLGEEWQIKRQKQDQAVFDNAWKLGQKWLREEEIKYEKAWRLGEIWQIRQEQSASKVGVAHEKAAKTAIWSWENFSNQFDRMGIRMIASLIWFTAISEGVMLIWTAWTKVSDETQNALDKLKSYFDSFKELQLKLSTNSIDISVSEDTKKKEFETYDKLMRKHIREGDMQKAYNQYQNIQGLVGNTKILDEVRKEDFIKNGLTARMEEQLKNAENDINVSAELANAKQEYADILKVQKTNEDERNIQRKRIIDDLRSGDEKHLLDKASYDKFIPGKGGQFSYEDRINPKQYTDDELLSIARKYTPEISSLDSNDPNHVTNSDIMIAMHSLIKAEMQKGSLDLQAGNAASRIKDNIELKDEYDTNSKDKAPKKGPKDRTARIELEDMKSAHLDKLAANKLEFEESEQTLRDKIELHNKDLNEVKEYNKKTKDYIDSHLNLIKANGLDVRKVRQDISKETENERSSRLKEMQADSLAFKRYNDERLKELREIGEKQLQIAQEFEYKARQEKQDKLKQDNQLKRSKSFNPFLAFFGDGIDKKQEYNDQLSELKSQVKNVDTPDVVDAFNVYQRASEKKNSAQDKVDQNKSFQLNPTASQRITSKEDNDNLKKSIEEQYAAQKDYEAKLKKLKDDGADTSKLISDKKKSDEIAVAKAGFNATEKIANDAFAAQQNRIAMSMKNLQSYYSFEMTLAGNNSSAKTRLAISEHNTMVGLEREAAKSKKTQGIFNASINMAEGITNAWTLSPPMNFIMAGIVAAADIAQIAEISKEPLPSYAKGKKKGEGRTGRALINEDGPEFIERKGAMYIFAGGKKTVANIEQDDIIHTNRESERFLNHLLKGTGVIKSQESRLNVKVETKQQDFITKQDMEDILRKLPAPQIVQPAKSLQDRLTRTQLRNGL